MASYNDINQITNAHINQYTQQRKHKISESFDTIISGCDNRMPVNPHYQGYSIPKDLKNGKKTQDFFNQERITAIMPQLGIKLPAELILAEEMGLGHFAYQFHAPEALKKRHRKSEKHGHKYKLEACHTGMEINFYYQGRCIPIYAPQQITGKHDFGKLSDAYRYVIQHGTKSVYNQEIGVGVKQSLIADICDEKKKLALTIFNTIKDNLADVALQANWLLSYLTAAGFPPAIKDRVQAIVQVVNASRAYEQYAQYAGTDTPFPEFTVIDRSFFKEIITSIVECSKQAAGFTLAQSCAGNPILSCFEAAKQCIYETQMLSLAAIDSDDKPSFKSCVAPSLFGGSGVTSTSSTTLRQQDILAVHAIPSSSTNFGLSEQDATKLAEIQSLEELPLIEQAERTVQERVNQGLLERGFEVSGDLSGQNLSFGTR